MSDATKKWIITVTRQRVIVVPKKYQPYVLMRHIEIGPEVHLTDCPTDMQKMTEPYDPRIIARTVRDFCNGIVIANFNLWRIKILFMVFSPEIMYHSILSSHGIYLTLVCSLGSLMTESHTYISTDETRVQLQKCLDAHFIDLCEVFRFDIKDQTKAICYNEPIFWPLLRRAIHDRRSGIEEMLKANNYGHTKDITKSFWFIYDTMYPLIEENQ